MPSFPLTLSIALGRLVASRSLCPSSCTATLDGSSFPCRYHGNNCMVSVSPSAARSSAEDINVAVINPYVGGLGDLMTMVEPSIAQALQDIEESNFLPGYRLNGYVVDSKCSVPDATSAAIAAMTTGPAKHVVFGDSCSAACEAVNDALRHFNVMQVGPGCVSVSLSDSTRFPYFTRMAPSFRFNVQTVYEIFKFLGFRRVGVVYGYRSINVLAKDLFLELMSGDNSAGSYSWTPLYTHRVELLQDAQSAVEEARRTDARINFMALYEAEGSMVLCQCHKKNMLTPDYNWFVASGWWNQNFILLTADTEKSPCSVSELQRAAYSLIAIDRGPMLDTSELHSLSGRPLSELYAEYTGACQGFANGKGVCNHQLAGYFYDGVWLIASILHTYLVEQNRSIADLGTEESRQALYDLSLSTDFYGQTGRVRQFNSVEPKTSPPSHGDRDGTLLLRQATGPVDQVFVELAFRTEAGFDFKTEIRWSPDGSKMVSCLGASCDLAGGWLPPDRSSSCPGGEVWTNTEGCTQCSPGDFATAAMLACAACEAGGFSNFSGADACQPCAPGFFAANTGATACAACGQGEYLETSSGTACLKCPAGTFGEAAGLTQCAECPPGRSSDFEGTSSARMCSCRPETRLEEEECVPCADTEVCEGGRVVATRPSAKQWLELVEQMSLLEAQGETMARLFLQIAAGIQVNSSKASLLDLMDVYNSSLFSIIFGDSANNIPAPTSPEVQDALEDALSVWLPLRSLLADNVDTVRTGVDTSVVGAVTDSSSALYYKVDAAWKALVDDADEAGAKLNGLAVNIAERQRILIQRMCKDVLLVAHAVSLDYSFANLQSVVGLYEESGEGIVFGIRAAGVPELTDMCTMHQMREVSFYYQQVRPFMREVLNAQSSFEASEIASAVVGDVVRFVDPLYAAMVAAAHLYLNSSSASCDPLVTTTWNEWRALSLGICDTRIGLQRSLRFFMQIANGLAVQESKVELTVVVAKQTQLMRDLVTGNKMDDMPAPVTQKIMDKVIHAREAWSNLADGLDEAIQQDELPKVDVLRGLLLGNVLFEDLMDAMELFVAEAAVATVQSRILDLTHRQQFRFHQLPVKAYQILLGIHVEEAWRDLNATVTSFRQMRRDLVLGAPGSVMELKPVTNVCIARMMSKVFDTWYELEQACYAVARGDGSKVRDINLLSSRGHSDMEAPSHGLERFYEGQWEVCENLTLGVADWTLLMAEVTRLAQLSQRVMSSMVAAQEGLDRDLTVSLAELRASLERLILGFPNMVPVQPTQALFRRILDVAAPAVDALASAVAEGAVARAQSRAGELLEVARALLRVYTGEGLQQEPSWPGQRVQLAMWQSVLAQKLAKEAVISVYNVATLGANMDATIRDFETAQSQLRDGSGDVPNGIVPERDDLLKQWERVNLAWSRFVASLQSLQEMEPALLDLLAELERAVPLYGVRDIESPDVTPWGFYIAYALLGLVLLCCSCAACYVARKASKKAQSQDCSQV